MAAQRLAKKPRRRPNFVDAASLALIAGVKRRRDVLLDAEAKREDKADAWQEVTKDVNAVAHYHRDTWEVRRKYKDLRVVAKRKALQLRKYGPSEAEAQGVRLTDVDAAVLDLFPLPANAELPVPRAVNGHFVNVAAAVEAAPPTASLPVANPPAANLPAANLPAVSLPAASLPAANLPAVGEIWPSTTVTVGGENEKIIILPEGSFEAIGVDPSVALPGAVSRPDSRCSSSAKSFTKQDEDPLELDPAFSAVPPPPDIRDAVQELAAAVRQNTAAVSALVDAQRQTAEALGRVVDALCGYKQM